VRVRYEAAAIADLRAVIDYGLEQGLPDPVAFVRELRQRIAVLATQPRSGRAGRIPGTREWPLPGTPYIVVYVQRQTVDVLRVLHGRQQPPTP